MRTEYKLNSAYGLDFLIIEEIQIDETEPELAAEPVCPSTDKVVIITGEAKRGGFLYSDKYQRKPLTCQQIRTKARLAQWGAKD